jgi:hypothetical protein
LKGHGFSRAEQVAGRGGLQALTPAEVGFGRNWVIAAVQLKLHPFKATRQGIENGRYQSKED